MRRFAFILSLGMLYCSFSTQAQRNKKEDTAEKTPLEQVDISGLKFRNVGPAITSGRIADFAVDPDNPKVYYVATASGGVWKTVNGGITYEPVFDSQGSYSIGCISMDPNNPNVIWVGTGENNNQRSVSYGDGVYKSVDGGKSWEHMGLKSSEHNGQILIDPRNSDVVYVAAIGPLWQEGGERGLYKTTDGGKSWEAILSIDEHTGINQLLMDPRNPDVLYAAAHQRRRHVFTYIGGGPGSGIYKSTDAGANWEKINKGLPETDLGRTGLSMSPANPEIIYAIVEAARGKGGFYRTTNRGASWEKMSDYVTSGNYYQEIVADPLDPDKIYAMDTWMHISTDGGKTFKVLGEDTKHVDNHCMWIDPADTDHFLVGCDGGIYETFDAAKTWLFKPNLPVTQFYKVALDSARPFYNIYGGTQDNFSMGGPSRTLSNNGIANSDWFMTHGGDGFESQVDPDDPNIIYAQSQYGFLVRYDKLNGEEVGIQPKERKGEDAYRWNWDAPLSVSTHQPGRIYFAANKLFRSDDRGNSWEVISDDLTRQVNRNKLEVMDRVWSMDAVEKNGSTSPYGTIVSFAESPLNANLLYVGTDDGLIQITENGGTNWRSIGSFPDVPERTYVNALWASQHDENVVYAAFNHHKYGDFSPYLYKSDDKGRSWSKITANLPERGSVYAIAEDHVDADLLFAGTEFGAFFSNNGGQEWKQLNAGLPTIAIRDMAIHKGENDLVLASFGRGFFVLDDYSVLRNVDNELLAQEAALFEVRDALLYESRYPLGLPGKSFQGDSYYQGENLPSVAMFTYYLKEDIKTLAEQREEKEKVQLENQEDAAYPSYEQLQQEQAEEAPYLLFTIKDDEGKLVRKLNAPAKKGLQRINWDLRFASVNPITLSTPSFYNPFAGKDEGTLVAPGEYTVTLSKSVNGEITPLAEAVTFTVKPLEDRSIPLGDPQVKIAFQQDVNELYRKVQASQQILGEINSQLKHMEAAAKKASLPQEQISDKMMRIKEKMREIEVALNTDLAASKLDMDKPPTVGNRVGMLVYEQFYSTSPPTQTHQDSYKIAKEEFTPVLAQIKEVAQQDVPELQQMLEEAGAPYTPYAIPVLVEE
ncbi:glycosyl hydrolase [Catalinimonas sp. 4WD22]|uniref:VPS10 domain-containing protein n=1 Tax=Catalinimonas locisalis TaxID=3133978 RepID=UPI00310188D8